MGALNGFVKDNLFDGQTTEFFTLLADLAADADRAQPGGDNGGDGGD
jgi:hypothetical protein